MFLGYRSNDPVITICQDNQRKRVDIKEINRSTEELLGYSAQEMENKQLADFLPARIRSLLNEYVEFEDDGNDVGSVLSKVQSFCINDSKGREVGFRLKVLRSESLDRNAYFKLILQSSQGNRRTEAFRSVLRENFKGHEVLDPSTNLPDRKSLTKDIELVLFYVHKNELTASFAVLDLDDYPSIVEKYGPEMPAQMLQHIASLARQNLRTDDTIGSLPPRRVGIILLDTNLESARMVLNRLRWLIAANPFVLPDKTTVPLTVSIAFAPLGGRTDDKAVVQDAEIYMDRLQTVSGNTLQEVTEITIRKDGFDRRQQNVPVAMDRRKGDRRMND